MVEIRYVHFSYAPSFFEGRKGATKLANFPYRSIHFYVNNPKTADEIFSTEINFHPLTLFFGGGDNAR